MKRKKVSVLDRFSAYWLRSSVVSFAALDPILAELKLSVILWKISVTFT